MEKGEYIQTFLSPFFPKLTERKFTTSKLLSLRS